MSNSWFSNKKRQKLLDDFGQRKNGFFDFNGIRRFTNLKDTTEKELVNDRTWADLDLDELYMFLDLCVSAVGQQCLYAHLRGALSIKSVDDWEKQVAAFQKDAHLREKAIVELGALNDPDAHYLQSLFQEKYLKKPKWFLVFRIMSIVGFLSIPAMLLIPNFWLFGFLILSINFALHYWNKRNLYLYSRSVPQLVSLINASERLVDSNPNPDQALDASIRRLGALKGSLAMFRLEKGMQSELGQLAELVAELIKAYFLLEPITLFSTLEKLEDQKEDIERLYSFTGELDLCLALGALRQDLPHWCIPHFTESESVNFRAIYHPLIEKPVSNHLALEDKSLLLTGSNMSGKTTFIRTVGINVICARALNTCFCESYQAPALHASSAIRISDDVMSDKSYFQEEMLVVKSMLEESTMGSRRLFLMDELMKGTNTLERVAVGKAVLDELANNGNLVLVATHDLELADLLADQYALYHFSEVIEDQSIEFDYLLKPGKLHNTNAIRILEINGYPEALTQEARKIVTDLKQPFSQREDH